MAETTSKSSKSVDKGKSSKNVLMNSFENKWQHIEENTQREILEKLTSFFTEFGLKSIKKRKVKPKDLSSSVDEENKKEDTSSDLDKKTVEVRSQVVFGVNEVTRQLERDNIRLVLVSGSANPAVITKHLIELSATRNCPALCLKDLNSSLSQVLNFRSVLAVGFKKKYAAEQDHLREFVDFTVSCAPTDRLPQISAFSEEYQNSDPEVKKSELETVDVTQPSELPHDAKISEPDIKDCKSITETCSHSTDYSRFYVYKKKTEEKSQSKDHDRSEDFIAFSTAEINNKVNQKQEYENKTPTTAIKRKIVDSGKTVYSQAQIKQLKGNPKRHKKKKK